MELGTSKKMIDSDKRVNSKTPQQHLTTVLKSLLFRQFVVAVGDSGLVWRWELVSRYGPYRDVSEECT